MFLDVMKGNARGEPGSPPGVDALAEAGGQERTASPVAGIVAFRETIEEKHLNQDALVASERRHRQVVDNLQEAVFQTDAEGNWTFLNPAWQRITGFTVEESLGKLFIEFVEPEDRQRNYDLFRPLAERSVDSCRYEIRYRHRDGGVRWIEVFTRLVIDDDGGITGTVGSLTDISEKKLAEEIRRKDDERLRRLTDSIPALVCQFVVSPEGSISFHFASEGSRAVFGIEPDALTMSPASLTGRIHPDDLPGFQESIQRNTHELSHWTWTGRYLHPDGTTRWLRGWAQPERAVDGVVVWNGMFVDATDEHAAVAELRQSREQYELAVDGSSCGIWDWDLAANQIYFSPRWKEMLGYRDEELVNSPDTFRELVHSEDLPRVMAALERCMRGETKSYEVEFRMWARDASYRWILARGAALHDAAGRPFRMAGSHTDITERKKADSVQQALIGCLRMALDDLPSDTSPDALEFLKISYDSAQRLENDINDVADYVQARKTVAGLHRFPVREVGPLLHSVATDLLLKNFRTETDPQLDMANVGLSGDQIGLIARELLENSVNFHPGRRPSVRAVLVPRGTDRVSLQVMDDGVTLAPNQLLKAFSPYYQGSRFETGEQTGMGLGLSVVGAIVGNAGGQCHLINRDPGPGVIAEIILPTSNA